MGSVCIPGGRHYDLSMSKRTRKPVKPEGNDQQQTIATGSPESENSSTVVEDSADHRSLKELIDGEGETKLNGKKGEAKPIDGEEEEGKVNGEGEQKRGRRNRGGNSLSDHFTEEKHLQMVTKQQGEGMEGVKLSGMVSRYMKVLNHFIKVKKDPPLGSRKKPVFRLTM